MQSACLLSDMEAFKAANPGCCMGDFVRWYSPRDWVQVEAVDDDGNVAVKGASHALLVSPSINKRLQVS
jgi:Rab3 GTPase-activating protein catalytic subunit